MLEARNVVEKARMALGDIEEDRWDTNRLLDLVDEAQKDICLNTHLYRREAYLPLVVGQYMYDLPEDMLIVHRVQSLNEKIPFTTKDTMDGKNWSWRETKGETISLVMKDSIPMNQLEVYPIPDGDMFYIPTYKGISLDEGAEISLLDVEGVWSDFTYGDQRATMANLTGVFTGIKMGVTIDVDSVDPEVSVWGVLVDYYTIEDGVVTLEYEDTDYPISPLGVTSEAKLASGSSEDTSLFGVMVELDPNYGYLASGWGAISSIIQEGSVLKVFYTAVPPTVSSNNTPLILSSIWEAAMKYYVAGYALMDDNDAGNMARGGEFLKRYLRELERAKTLSTVEQHDAVGSRVTQFQTAFRR